MRNIIKGLEQRVEEAKAESARLKRVIIRLDMRSELLKQALELEKAQWVDNPEGQA